MRKKIIFSGLIISLIFLVVAGYFLFKELKTSTKLNNFYSLTKEDPLFYSSFLDAKEFRIALEGLKIGDKQFKKIAIENYIENENPENIESSYYIETLKNIDTFPYQFFDTLILINQTTDRFLENPSKEKGHQLLALYTKAADSYLQNISSLIEVIETIEEEQRKKTILFLDSQTNLNIILKDYQTIKKNAYVLQEEIKQRKECLENRVNCPEPRKDSRIDFFLQSLQKSLDIASEGENIGFIKTSFPIIAPKEIVKGPYKIESACWESSDNNHWMYLIHDKDGDVNVIIPKLVKQNYYLKTRIPPQHKIEKVLADRKINFRATIETHHYNCADLTFYPTLLVLDFLKEEATKKKVEIKQLAEKSQYKFLLENQFGLLSPAINRITSAINFHTQQYMLEKEHVPPIYYLYGVHSSYSIFYLPYAKSVWRLNEKLQYLTPKKEKIPIAEADRRFYTLDELKDMNYSEEEIGEFHVDLLELLDSLLNQDRF